MVLVIVLCIVLCLVSVVLLFGDSMRMYHRIAANQTAGVEAGQAVEGARRYIAYVLGNLTTPGAIPDRESYQNEAVPIADAQFWIIGRSNDEMDRENTPLFALVDEASKLNLNTAAPEMLEWLPDMTPELAAAIVDWRDADSDPQPGGAESEAYVSEDPAYECKNAPFETVEELRLVKGFTWALLYGEDANRNGLLDPNENDGEMSFPDDDADGRLRRGLLDYLTVFTREPNKRSDGSARVDVRRPREPAVAALLEQTLGAERAAEIVRAAVAASRIRSVLEFYIVAGVTLEEAAQLEDSLTAHDGDYVTGLVNISTAPREVLVCIPGIGEEHADELIGSRLMKTTDQLATVAWATEVLDRESAVLAGPLITARAYQFGADAVAVGRLGRAFRRTWMVFDTSGSEPVVVYRCDWTGLGWPLGLTIRDHLDVSSIHKRSVG